jgi:putative glutathione S-transferase
MGSRGLLSRLQSSCVPVDAAGRLLPFYNLPMNQGVTLSDGPTWQKQIRNDGEFVRRDSTFREWISRTDGAAFSPESGRYHLYVSLACPWAHRALIVRHLKGLESVISFNVTDWFLPHRGWTFRAESEGATKDTVNGLDSLRDLYELVHSNYSGSVTVPTLWDKKHKTIVNNESSEIIRMFNAEFDEHASVPDVDLYPVELRSEIDAVNEWIYALINDGVYQAGFARSQTAYERAARGVFEGLDRCEALLSERRYIAGRRLTEADVRLWTTLIRFDAVYLTHFKCNLLRLTDYPNLWAYTRELYAHPAFRCTTDFGHIKRHYFESHESINPHRIVPIGPSVDYEEPHDRQRLACDWFPQI